MYQCMEDAIMELCLGTVQNGMRYGINNQINRQPTWEESFEIFNEAFASGITMFDTARAYGEAELVLGKWIKEKGIGDSLKIVSKLRPNVIDNDDVRGTVEKEILDSLNRLGIEKLNGYLLHTPEYIYRNDIIDAMQYCKKMGYTDNIGVSIYNLEEGYAAVDTDVIDYIQMPYSILDQRGIKSGLLKACKDKGITVFARSAFLQGLLMMECRKIPDHMKNSVKYIERVNHIIEQHGADLLSTILHFIKQENVIDYLVFGVETLDQIKEDIKIFNSEYSNKKCIEDLKEAITDIEESVIIPSLWSDGGKAE